MSTSRSRASTASCPTWTSSILSTGGWGARVWAAFLTSGRRHDSPSQEPEDAGTLLAMMGKQALGREPPRDILASIIGSIHRTRRDRVPWLNLFSVRYQNRTTKYDHKTKQVTQFKLQKIPMLIKVSYFNLHFSFLCIFCSVRLSML